MVFRCSCVPSFPCVCWSSMLVALSRWGPAPYIRPAQAVPPRPFPICHHSPSLNFPDSPFEILKFKLVVIVGYGSVLWSACPPLSFWVIWYGIDSKIPFNYKIKEETRWIKMHLILDGYVNASQEQFPPWSTFVFFPIEFAADSVHHCNSKYFVISFPNVVLSVLGRMPLHIKRVSCRVVYSMMHFQFSDHLLWSE